MQRIFGRGDGDKGIEYVVHRRPVNLIRNDLMRISTCLCIITRLLYIVKKEDANLHYLPVDTRLSFTSGCWPQRTIMKAFADILAPEGRKQVHFRFLLLCYTDDRSWWHREEVASPVNVRQWLCTMQYDDDDYTLIWIETLKVTLGNPTSCYYFCVKIFNSRKLMRNVYSALLYKMIGIWFNCQYWEVSLYLVDTIESTSGSRIGLWNIKI